VRKVDNPPNPWHTRQCELLEPPPPVELHVYEEAAKSILSHNDSPDLSFSWSVNPYRGCHHACAYCYARPTHQYLDWGAGTDFETRIVVKVNAPELLRAELRRREAELRGEWLAFSGVTDCYQPLEACYELTRRCLVVCRDLRQRVTLITKGALVERDAQLLAEVHAAAGAHVMVSLAFADAGDARALEPHVAAPERRLRTIAALRAAGVPVGVLLAPLIPGLNDHQIPEILRLARAAGAERASMICLRLPAEVHDVFTARLRQALPLRAEKVLHALEEVRGGRLQEARFGARMQGNGPRWAAIEALFRVSCQRLGLTTAVRTTSTPALRQQDLFGQ
jgi:DNA repair photolyase